MRKLLLQLHNYVGLVNFVFLMVLGVVGIHVTLMPDPRTAPKPEPVESTEVDFQAPGDVSDVEIARLAYDQFGDPTAGFDPYPRRNEKNQLVCYWWGPNGQQEATYLEAQKKLRIARYRVEDGEFLNRMHTIGLANPTSNLPLKIWRLYVELAMVSLLFMAITGLYLWLAARWHVRWAQLVLLFSVAVFGILYWGVR